MVHFYFYSNGFTIYLSNTIQLITQLVNSLLWFTITSLHNTFTLIFFFLTPRLKYLDGSFTKLSFHFYFNGFTTDLFSTLLSDKTSAIYTTRQPFTSLHSLTGKLQGKITKQGDPCSHYREFTECNFLLFWLNFFPCFINVELVALVPVMCTGNCQFILQGLKGCFNTL